MDEPRAQDTNEIASTDKIQSLIGRLRYDRHV